MKNNIASIILAAGKGERMKSETPKVLHRVCGRPMVNYVLDLVKELKIKNNVVVLGHKAEEVKKVIPEGFKIAIQKKLAGTADAVKEALPKLAGISGSILVLYGDIPLLKKETLKNLLGQHVNSGADLTVLTATLDKPSGYGRILRDRYSAICGIVEEKDADDFEKDIKEINTGIFCVKKDKLEKLIKRIRPNNRKKEYYLTDIFNLIYKNGGVVEGMKISDIDEAMGINSRVELAKAIRIMQGRINEKFMQQGVTIVASDSVFINFGVKIGTDSVIYPFTVIENDVKIGKRCSVGPFAHLREGTELKDEVLAGNFIEFVRSRIGSKTFLKHFCYIGDTHIGSKANIGAGTVTANFDGQNKNLTEIKDSAFVGCDTIIVAPAKIGKSAVTGAGSVILRHQNIKDGETVAGVPAKIIKRKR
ncbi:MAG: NTP transferase domain-containing protein [Candidatus Omnitrophica bacterium]|nr:NTP transferase domain-containing protein [Candidatus Omnitrophota bacterium]